MLYWPSLFILFLISCQYYTVYCSGLNWVLLLKKMKDYKILPIAPPMQVMEERIHSPHSAKT